MVINITLFEGCNISGRLIIIEGRGYLKYLYNGEVIDGDFLFNNIAKWMIDIIVKLARSACAHNDHAFLWSY